MLKLGLEKVWISVFIPNDDAIQFVSRSVSLGQMMMLYSLCPDQCLHSK